MSDILLKQPRWATTLKRLDPVWAVLAVAFAILFLIVPAQAQSSAVFVADAAFGVLPFLLMSILIAAYCKATGADGLIARAFRGHTVTMIVSAAFMGALSPFCSCGVIPLIAALLTMGVPLPAVMAFWLASPLMDPSMFILTVGTLGLDFALYKTFAAIVIGLLGGFGTAALARGGLFANPLRDGVGNGGCGASAVRNPSEAVWKFWQEEGRVAAFSDSAKSSLFFLGKWLLFAFFLESLMVAYVPQEAVAGLLGGEGFAPIVTATLIGVPAYLNGYAALPLVSGLIEQGMQPGAGMAFLLAGGVTSIPASIAVFALARLPVFFTYLGFALLGALSLSAGFSLLV